MTYRLHQGDCMDVLPTLTGVDAVVTDPPYGMNNDCNYTRFSMGPHGKASSRKYASVIGDDRPFDPSPWLKYPNVILWGYNHFAERLPVGTLLVWIKKLDGGFGTFLSDAEVAWQKGGHGVYCQRDTSLLAETNNRLHPTQKPIGIMRWCIERVTKPGDTVLDPYMGSGTTGVAAIQAGRNFIGIELDPTYYAIAERRIANAQPPLFVADAPIALPVEQATMFAGVTV
jgi:site-specific DNA-methyltransferase (adenine-specific)